MNKAVYFIAFIALFTSSCKVFNPSVMMRTPSDYEFAQFADSVTSEYRLAPNDIVSFRLYANDGFKIIDLSTSADKNAGIAASNQQLTQYQIEFDGQAKLPILGRVDLKGLTIREAEATLEERYREYYVNPFIQLSVLNRRVVVFTGGRGNALSGGSFGSTGAKVVDIQNEATTILEVLALAGGISGTGKAYKIKLIRGDLKNPEVYKIDLSTIEGIRDANLFVEAGDIIYVEPTLGASSQLLETLGRLLQVVSTSVLTYILVRQL